METELIILAVFAIAIFYLARKLRDGTSGILSSGCGMRILFGLVILIFLIILTYYGLKYASMEFSKLISD